MHSSLRNGLLLVGLATLGCTEQRSAETTPARTAVSLASADHELTSRDKILFGEQVADGSPIDPFANPESKAVVLVFVSTVCPVANRYAPELRRLFETFQPQNVAFWLVYADNDETSEMIRRHAQDYQNPIPAIRDPDHRLAKFCAASRTPEAVVFAPGRQQRYRGRIDDRVIDYGKSRDVASQHDLQEAIAAVLAGRDVPVPVTAVIGCPIPGVDE